MIEPPSNRHKHLGHERDADGKGGRDDQGLEELELAGQSHLHNVGEQVYRPELRADPVGCLKPQTTSLVHECSPAITVEVSLQVQGVEYQSLSLKTLPDPWRKSKPS